MPCPRFDFHIHTKYLGCGNATMEVEAIVRECERLGLTAIALTDHLNTLDRLKDHVPILEDIRKVETDVRVYFGCELNFTGCDAGFACSEQVKEEYGFQFAVGGIHGSYLTEYDPRKLVDIQHRHHLKTCRDPLVQVLVHPYWFGRGEFDRNGWPWFDSMTVVPESYARELAQTAKETGTAIELNGCASLAPGYGEDWIKSYMDYLAVLAGEGVVFSVGSDAHGIQSLAGIQWAWEAAEKLGLPPERIWRPGFGPVVGG